MTCHLEAGSEPTSRTGSFEVWLPGPRGRTGCRFPVADDRGALGDQRGRAPDLDRSAKRCPEERMPKDHRGGEQEPARGERTEPPPPGGGEEHARLVRAALDGVPERVEQLADLGGGVHERTLPSALGPANEAPNGEEPHTSAARYPTPRTVSIRPSCAGPSFARSRRTWTSTVRVPP